MAQPSTQHQSSWSFTSAFTYFFGWLTGYGSTTATAPPPKKRSRAIKNVADKPAATPRKSAASSTAPPRKKTVKATEGGKSSDKRKKAPADPTFQLRSSDESSGSEDDYDLPPKKTSKKRPRAAPSKAGKEGSPDAMEEELRIRSWKDILKTEVGINKMLGARSVRTHTLEFLKDHSLPEPEEKKDIFIPEELVNDYIEFITPHLPKTWLAKDDEGSVASEQPKKKKQKKEVYKEEEEEEEDEDEEEKDRKSEDGDFEG